MKYSPEQLEYIGQQVKNELEDLVDINFSFHGNLVVDDLVLKGKLQYVQVRNPAVKEWRVEPIRSMSVRLSQKRDITNS